MDSFPLSLLRKYRVLLILCLAFGLWLGLFQEFLLGRRDLASDAISYFEHTRFYLDHLQRGVYPLWNPDWTVGSPNEFFLRRIGPYNPFLFLVLFMKTAGVPFVTAYLSYLSLYYFGGVIGFFLLARHLWNDERPALAAALLLLFSSLGTRVFDSYLVLLFTPMIWFFYFYLSFAFSPRKYSFLGAVFCVMILATTYIPFYFFIIAILVLLCSVPFYWGQTVAAFRRTSGFIGRNKGFAVFCAGSVLLSLVPGILYFQNTAAGGIALPFRHFDSQQPHILGIDQHVITYWAVIEDILYSTFYLRNFHDFQFATFYVPTIVYVLFLLSLLTKINRLTLALFTTMLLAFLFGSPYLSPLYSFCYGHIFFFKYFRNLHFFLWLVILPAMLLFSVEQLRQLMDSHSSMTDRRKKLLISFIFLFIHAGLMTALWLQKSQNMISYFSLGLSLIILSWGLLVSKKDVRNVVFGVLFLLIVAEPLYAYRFFVGNAPASSSAAAKSSSEQKPSLLRPERILPTGREPQRAPEFYYGTQWYYFLKDKVDYRVLAPYLRYKFVVYDKVEYGDDQTLDFKRFEDLLRKNADLAIVGSEDAHESPGVNPPEAQRIEDHSTEVRIIRADANRMSVETRFVRPQFLVFNDSYYPGWKVFINGKEGTLFRANVAFKGVWVPAGESSVDFRFGDARKYAFEIFMVVFFFAVLMTVLFLWRRDKQLC